MKSLQAPEERHVVIQGRRSLGRDPSKEFAIGNFDEPLELRQLFVRHCPDLRVGETPHDEIHLAHATMPCPVEDAPTTWIEAGARACRPAHEELRSCFNASQSDGLAAI